MTIKEYMKNKKAHKAEVTEKIKENREEVESLRQLLKNGEATKADIEALYNKTGEQELLKDLYPAIYREIERKEKTTLKQYFENKKNAKKMAFINISLAESSIEDCERKIYIDPGNPVFQIMLDESIKRLDNYKKIYPKRWFAELDRQKKKHEKGLYKGVKKKH